ncbi:MAG: polymerase [Comamonadaceae bacterium]|nr:MAG: polymerase [Comamonadaceae bacterium]
MNSGPPFPAVASAAHASPWRFAPAALVALPFVFPVVAGPSANVWQLLASWVCMALLLLCAPAAVPASRVLAWLGAGAAAVAVSPGSDVALVLGACAALAAMVLAAAVGAGIARAEPAFHRALAAGLLAAGLVSAVLGLLQYLGLAAWLVPLTTAPEPGQAYGNLRQRNQFATLINMALVAALWLHADGGRVRRRVVVGACVVLMMAAAASTSRTGLLQLAAIAGVAGALAWRERRKRPPAAATRLPHPLVLTGLLAVYALASWLLPGLVPGEVDGMLTRLREGAPVAHSRMVLWRNVLELVAQHPWRGWGWGELSFAHYVHPYAHTRFVEILDNAHNLPLHLAVELGLPAAVVLCAGFACMVLSARPWREYDARRAMAWGVMGVIVLHSLLEYPLWYGPFQLAFGLCLGLLWPGTRVLASSGAPWWPALAASLLLATSAWAGRDYVRVSQLYLAREERLPALRDDTLAKLRDTRLYASTVDFAALAMMQLTPSTAEAMYELSGRMLHFSPEPRVIVKRIESGLLLGHLDEAHAEMARFERAFPLEYMQWRPGREAAGGPD